MTNMLTSIRIVTVDDFIAVLAGIPGVRALLAWPAARKQLGKIVRRVIEALGSRLISRRRRSRLSREPWTHKTSAAYELRADKLAQAITMVIAAFLAWAGL